MPERMCIVTREVKDEADLLRFVRSPDGMAAPDLNRKLPGRGVWVSLDRGRLSDVIKGGQFSRGFKAQTHVPEGLLDLVAVLLKKQVMAHLSLARKAGEAVAGFFKVEQALEKGPVKVLIHAAGAGADGVRKLDRLARPGTLICPHLPGDDLDLAFSKPNVVHAAVAEGGLAQKLELHVTRWARYEGLELGRKT
jgi:uncharacterized protein